MFIRLLSGLLIVACQSLVRAAVVAPEKITPRIIGGQNAESPYGFSVHTVNGYLCGGVLVHNDIMVTAAHCDKSFEVGSKVYVGARQLRNEDLAGVLGFVEVREAHPDYEAGPEYNDIMIIKLNRSVVAVDPERIQPALINRDANLPLDRSIAIIMGYGYTSAPQPKPAPLPNISNILQEASVPIIPAASCTGSYAKNVVFPETMHLCAGGNDTDACEGDSGGGLFQFDSIQSRWVLYGITSFGIGCATPRPGIYSRVSHFSEWIDDFICTNSDEPPLTCLSGFMSLPTLPPTSTPVASTPSPTTATSTERPSPSPSLTPTPGPTDEPTNEPTNEPTEAESAPPTLVALVPTTLPTFDNAIPAPTPGASTPSLVASSGEESSPESQQESSPITTTAGSAVQTDGQIDFNSGAMTRSTKGFLLTCLWVAIARSS